MSGTQLASNPFALLVDPEAVLTIIERSDRLARLQSRICRPLDKPLIAHAAAGGEEAEATLLDASGAPLE